MNRRKTMTVENNLEILSAVLHDLYQQEAKRQGDVRHKDRYEDLPENIKEFDRVLARYILAREAKLQAELAVQKTAGEQLGRMRNELAEQNKNCRERLDAQSAEIAQLKEKVRKLQGINKLMETHHKH
jgi:chromosome segregation ATPase